MDYVVNETTGCWVWAKCRKGGGYGYEQVEGNPVAAHRLYWTRMRGEIPEGMQVLHHCDNPPCVNPAHLYVGTRSDNMRDRATRKPGSFRDGSRFTNGERQAFIGVLRELLITR